jgi:hypothetical protein
MMLMSHTPLSVLKNFLHQRLAVDRRAAEKEVRRLARVALLEEDEDDEEEEEEDEEHVRCCFCPHCAVLYDTPTPL